MIKAKILLVLVSLFASALMLSQGVGKAYAQGNPNPTPPGHEQCKPGWGLGDDNHCHQGPPGHSTHPPGSTHPDDEDEKDELSLTLLKVKVDDLVALFNNNNFFEWLKSLKLS